MPGYLIKDTTREEREKIVEEALGNISGTCDGCSAGLAEMYQDYIDGKKERCRGQCILTDAGYINAVYNVIERLHRGADGNGERNLKNQFRNGDGSQL